MWCRKDVPEKTRILTDVPLTRAAWSLLCFGLLYDSVRPLLLANLCKKHINTPYRYKCSLQACEQGRPGPLAPKGLQRVKSGNVPLEEKAAGWDKVGFLRGKQIIPCGEHAGKIKTATQNPSLCWGQPPQACSGTAASCRAIQGDAHMKTWRFRLLGKHLRDIQKRDLF